MTDTQTEAVTLGPAGELGREQRGQDQHAEVPARDDLPVHLRRDGQADEDDGHADIDRSGGDGDVRSGG